MGATRAGRPTRRSARSSSSACSRQIEELLPVITFGSKQDKESAEKHEAFLERMVERGYTERQVRRLVEWYMRMREAG